jgi:hypothetical protein
MAEENIIKNSIKGDVSRSSYTFGNITGPDTKETEYKKNEQEVLKAESEKDSFLKAAESGTFVTVGKEKGGDSFIQAIDSGELNLNELEYTYSPNDMTMMGKFDRLNYLRELRKNGDISNTRYVSLKKGITLTLEEAALLEAEEMGRPIDPEEIEKDPILMNKYGFVELDADLAETIEQLQEAGVDVMSGAPADIRASVGRQSDEQFKLQALQDLQDEGQILFYKPSKLGMIITIPTPDGGSKDLLLDELGFDGKDFLDMISEVPGIVTNIAATAGAVIAAPSLATGGVISLAGLAAISGLSYFTGASASDIINRYFTNSDILAINEIAKTRGMESAIAAGFDFLLLGGVKLGKGIAQKFVGPVAGAGDVSIKTYLSSIAKGKQVIQYDQQGKIIFNKDGSPKLGDLQLTPGLETQSPTIQRVEGIAEKIPGSADVLQTQKDIIQKQLVELEMRAKGIEPKIVTDVVGGGREYTYASYPDAKVLTTADVGSEVSNFASKQLEADEKIINLEKNFVKTQADEALDKITGSISSTGKSITTTQAGNNVTNAVLNVHQNYIKKINSMYKDIKKIEGFDSDVLIDVRSINNLAKRIENQYPTKTKSYRQGDVDVPVLPQQLQGVLDDLKNLNNLTFEQAYNYKNILNNSLTNATVPTKADLDIMKVIQSLDKKMVGSLKAMGSGDNKLEIFKQYNNLQKVIANEGGIFNTSVIKGIINNKEQAKDILVPALLEGDLKTFKIFEKALGGQFDNVLQDAKSAAFNEMLRKSRSSIGDEFTNPKTLYNQITRLKPEVAEIIFGKKDYKKIKNLLNIIGAERGIIDIQQLSNMKGPFVKKLQKIYDLEKQAEKNYRNKFIKPFLKNSIGESEMNPADFTRYFVGTATPKEITEVLNKFSPDLQDKIAQRVIQDILESGRSADADLILKEFATGQTPPHPTLYKALYSIGGGDEALAKQKLTAIIGKDALELLEDVAGIQAGRRKTQDVAASAGGLVSGSIINQLTNLKFGNVGTIIKYRIAAKILSNPLGRSWLTSTKQIPAIGPKTVGISIPTREIYNLVEEEFKNEPELKKIAINELNRMEKDYKERAKEDREFNERLNQQRSSTFDVKPELINTVPNNVVPSKSTVEEPQASLNLPTVNSASRLANFNLTTPDPNTMDRGKQLFSGPNEITFASKGGIMNARKIMQRVI